MKLVKFTAYIQSMHFPTPANPLNFPLYDLLIVDDDAALRDTLESYFKSTGFTIRTAGSIREALQALGEFRFRCLLVDQYLPDGSGLNLLQDSQAMREDATAILMTGSQDQTVAIEAVNSGNVYKFLRKPFEHALMRRMVENAIAKFDGVRKSPAKRGDFLSAKSTQATSEWATTELQKAYLQSILSLTRAIEARDPYTHGHSERVYYYCSLIAEMLELSESSRNDLRFASVLHDIGKIGIPDDILRKKSGLTDSEYQIIRKHPLLSESIISALPFLHKVRLIVRHHHENFDGSGYPDGLRGSQIPIEARVLAVADAYDAMRSDRSYREAMPQEAARSRLVKGEGTQFCPLVLRAFLHALHKRGDYEIAMSQTAELDWKSGAFIDFSPQAGACNLP